MTILKIWIVAGIGALCLLVGQCIETRSTKPTKPVAEHWEIMWYEVVGQGVEELRLEIVLREQGSDLKLPYTFWSGTGTDVRISENRQKMAVWPVGENSWSPEVFCENCAELRIEFERIGAKMLSDHDPYFGYIYRL